MSIALHASIGTNQSIFFEAGKVTMTQPFSDTPPTDLTGVIEYSEIFVNAGWYVISSEGHSSIRFLDTFTNVLIEIKLGQHQITQITLNAFVEDIPESDYEVLGKGMRQYRGTLQCSVQCVLSDGSVWQYLYHRSKSSKSSDIQSSTLAFGDCFKKIEGLPPVASLLTVNTARYTDGQSTAGYFVSQENSLCQIVTFKNNVATYVVCGEFPSNEVSNLCIPLQRRGAPLQLHDLLYVRSGKVYSLDSTYQSRLPQYLIDLEDVTHICAATVIDDCCYFVVTSNQQLHIVLPDEDTVELFLPFRVNISERSCFVLTSEPGFVANIHITTAPGDSILVIGQTTQGLFFKISDDRNRCSVPAHMLHVKKIENVIDGFLPMHSNAVACGYNRIAVIQPDASVVVLELTTEGCVLASTPYQDAVAVALGWDHLLVLHIDGTVSGELVGNPREHDNQHIVPVGLTSVVAISCGEWMSYALRSNGTVVAWGRNDQDQVAPANYLTDIISVHGGRHHALFLGQGGLVYHIGSRANNDADTFPILQTDVEMLHSADIRAVAITHDSRVVDIFDDKIIDITQDESVIDVVATRGYYALLHVNGRLVILNRYAMWKDDEDPVYTDPVVLAGIHSIFANGDFLVCIGFDGRPYGLHSSEQGGFDPEIVKFAANLRVATPAALTIVPEDYDADACHEANTLALRLGVIKQTHAYMNAPKLPVF